jgi:hypothetical protein
MPERAAGDHGTKACRNTKLGPESWAALMPEPQIFEGDLSKFGTSAADARRGPERGSENLLRNRRRLAQSASVTGP